MSLKQAAASGTRWTSAATVLSMGLELLQIAILARLLAPEEFGFMAMTLLVVGFFHVFADLGVSNAIIHRQNVSTAELSSLYWLSILTGLLLYLVALSITPVVWRFFDEPILRTLIPIAALDLAILSLAQQFRVLMEKSLRFRELAVIQTIGAFAGTVVAISAALNDLGVLALVFGQLANSATRTILLARVGWCDWRPSLHLQLGDLTPYLRFGLFQTGEKAVNFLTDRVDQFLIGALLGVQELGYYSLAFNLVAVPIARLNPVLTRVAIPIFARVQNDLAQLKYGFATMRQVVAAMNFPLAFGAFAVAPVFVPLALGEQWSPVVVLIQILALVSVLRAMGNPIGSLLLAMGRPDLGFYFNCFAIVIQVPAIYLGAIWAGTAGVSLGLLATVIVLLLAEYRFLVRRLLGPMLRTYSMSFVPAASTALLMAIAVMGIPYLGLLDGIALLVVQIATGVVLYMLLNWLLYRQSTQSIMRLAFGRDT